jgi:hypothetical protein
MNTTTQNGIVSNSNIYTIPSSSGTSAFFDYYVYNSTTGAYRAGTVLSVWNGSIVSYTDTSTADLVASTSGIEFIVDIVSTEVRLIASITTGTWKVKIGVKII